ncbi:HAD family hydrolase [Chloroflexota bacterium]
MKYEAVIFDLFGTLVDVFSVSEYDDVLKNIASALRVPYDNFRPVWDETARDRSLGNIPTSRANLENVYHKLGIPTDNEKIELAAKIRHEFFEIAMKPRSDALDVLSQLRSKGIKLGLISNCAPATTEVWSDTPFQPLFDVTAFSCSVGLRKPDPRIYKLVMEQLVVKPENCLYIGDGSGNELTGAEEMGMQPVMIRVDYEDDAGSVIADRQEWDGPMISSLTEVLNLVE